MCCRKKIGIGPRRETSAGAAKIPTFAFAHSHSGFSVACLVFVSCLALDSKTFWARVGQNDRMAVLFVQALHFAEKEAEVKEMLWQCWQRMYWSLSPLISSPLFSILSQVHPSVCHLCNTSFAFYPFWIFPAFFFLRLMKEKISFLH